jgi:AraC-like DNA-binding protein
LLDSARVFETRARGAGTSGGIAYFGFRLQWPEDIDRAACEFPCGPYVLWLRLQCRAGELVRGKSVTDAAYTAGFSDAAHFTPHVSRMLGATPRQVLQRGIAAREFQIRASAAA